MKVTVDTKEDSHDDLRKVIKMLQHIIGDSQEVFSNQPGILSSQAAESSPIANIFGDISSASSTEQGSSDTPQAETPATEAPASEEASQSTEDLFAELFSEEEIKKMDLPKEEEAEPKPKDKNYSIEFY
ncbi:hypothetical protein HYX06_02670 [Candidatus Woesearchaeota archaeon]|nr:hypothetical protein [Candidatus Woesearchaeota archaeon]